MSTEQITSLFSLTLSISLFFFFFFMCQMNCWIYDAPRRKKKKRCYTLIRFIRRGRKWMKADIARRRPIYLHVYTLYILYIQYTYCVWCIFPRQIPKRILLNDDTIFVLIFREDSACSTRTFIPKRFFAMGCPRAIREWIMIIYIYVHIIIIISCSNISVLFFFFDFLDDKKSRKKKKV